MRKIGFYPIECYTCNKPLGFILKILVFTGIIDDGPYHGIYNYDPLHNRCGRCNDHA